VTGGEWRGEEGKTRLGKKGTEDKGGSWGNGALVVGG